MKTASLALLSRFFPKASLRTNLLATSYRNIDTILLELVPQPLELLELRDADRAGD
jgi:hypothetical protein